MTMNTIREMLDALTDNPEVLGLIEYGSAQYADEEISGDYDLIVVLKQSRPEVESLHFYIGAVPVDLNILSLEDIQDTCRATGFSTVLLEGRIIHDLSGRITQEIDGLKQRHAEVPQENHNLNIAGIRHGASHILDKIRNRQGSMPTLSSYLLHQGMYWIVPQYFQVRSLEFKGDKNALEYLREHEPKIFQDIEEFYKTTQHTRQADLFQSVAKAVLKSVGGLWNKDEVLTFGNQKKGTELFDDLFAHNDK